MPSQTVRKTFLMMSFLVAWAPFEIFAKKEAAVKPSSQTYRLELRKGSSGSMGDWTFVFQYRSEAKSTLKIENEDMVHWGGDGGGVGQRDESSPAETINLSPSETGLLLSALAKKNSAVVASETREFAVEDKPDAKPYARCHYYSFAIEDKYDDDRSRLRGFVSFYVGFDKKDFYLSESNEQLAGFFKILVAHWKLTKPQAGALRFKLFAPRPDPNPIDPF